RAVLGRVARLVCGAPPPLRNRPAELQRRLSRDRAAARAPGLRARLALPAQASWPTLAGRTPARAEADPARQGWRTNRARATKPRPSSAEAAVAIWRKRDKLESALLSVSECGFSGVFAGL